MVKTNGVVIDVFLPKQYKDGNLLDVMDRNLIGFKVKTDNGIKEVILKQDEYNAMIMKNSLVTITEQNISGVYFIDIELYIGDESDG